ATGELLAPLHHGGWVYHAVFSPDGRRLATACGDQAGYVWDVTAEERPFPDLVLLVQVLTGQRIEAAGRYLPLDPAQFRRDWGQLAVKSPAEFPAPPEPAPEGPARQHYRRARAAAERGRWDEAVADYTPAIELSPDDPALPDERGYVYERQGRWEKAQPDSQRGL